MEFRKILFRLVILGWICLLFIIGPALYVEFNMSVNEKSNKLQNAVAYTDLPYYTWGGSGAESAYDIARDSSNNTYIVGYTTSFGAGVSDICLLKFNSSGGLEWNQTYGGIDREWGTSIAIDSLDYLYITGHTSNTPFGEGGSDILVLKINSTGGVEWNYTWGGKEDEYGWSITLDSQNNAYVAGRTKSFGAGGFDMCLVKFNSSGVVWNYTCGGADNEAAYGITLDPQGNAYVVGNTKSFGLEKKDLYLVKFNSSGLIWNYTWGCADDDEGTEIICSPSGDLYVAGIYEKSSNCSKKAELGPVPQYITLIKFNSNGTYLWNNTWDAFNFGWTFGMVMDSFGNAYLAGYTPPVNFDDYDMCLVRFNSSGVADWSCNWGGSESELSQGLVLGPNGTVLVVGHTMSYGAGSADLCMVEFKIGQCPITLPVDGTPPLIHGYQTTILIGIAFTVSIFLIKKKLVLLKNVKKKK